MLLDKLHLPYGLKIKLAKKSEREIKIYSALKKSSRCIRLKFDPNKVDWTEFDNSLKEATAQLETYDGQFKAYFGRIKQRITETGNTLLEDGIDPFYLDS